MGYVFLSLLLEIEDNGCQPFWQGHAVVYINHHGGSIKPPLQLPGLHFLIITALQNPPFEPLRDIPIDDLQSGLFGRHCVSNVSLIWWLSCNKLFLIQHVKVVLHPRQLLFHKMVLVFLHNTGKVLPSLCPARKRSKEIFLHCLGIVRAITAYLKATLLIRKTNSLVVLSSGPHRGHSDSKSTIARCIRSLIAKAYTLIDISHPVFQFVGGPSSLPSDYCLYCWPCYRKIVWKVYVHI